MSNIKLSPEEEMIIANAMKENKPHLVKIEEMIQDTYDGSLEFTIDVRTGTAEKITILAKKTWVRGKEVDINSDS